MKLTLYYFNKRFLIDYVMHIMHDAFHNRFNAKVFSPFVNLTYSSFLRNIFLLLRYDIEKTIYRTFFKYLSINLINKKNYCPLQV